MGRLNAEEEEDYDDLYDTGGRGGDDDDEDDDDDDDDDEMAAGKNGKAGAADDELEESEHARRNRKMSERLSKYEAANVAEKPWQLTGEVSAASRPQNSLLEADLDFDHGGKAAPVITQEVTPRHIPFAHPDHRARAAAARALLLPARRF